MDYCDLLMRALTARYGFTFLSRPIVSETILPVPKRPDILVHNGLQVPFRCFEKGFSSSAGWDESTCLKRGLCAVDKKVVDGMPHQGPNGVVFVIFKSGAVYGAAVNSMVCNSEQDAIGQDVYKVPMPSVLKRIDITLLITPAAILGLE